MEEAMEDFDRALEAIRTFGFRHPDNELLECFLQDAIDPETAAGYVLQKCSSSSSRDNLDLGPLLSDWKQLIATLTCPRRFHQQPGRNLTAAITRRDGGRCCITGLGNSFLDPLIVAPILSTAIVVEPHLHEMLRVFVGHEAQQWILAGTSHLHTHANHWLVRKSAAMAMAEGYFEFTFGKGSDYCVAAIDIGGPTWPSILDKTPVLRTDSFTDHSAMGLDTPAPLSLQILSRFANSIRWISVAQDIAGKQLRTTAAKLPCFSLWHVFPRRRVTAGLNTAWRLLPASLRILAYRFLSSVGAYMYGPTCSLKVQQLPFGMYLKVSNVIWHESLANEVGALQVMRRHTRIPVPRPLDLVSNSDKSYLLTSRVPGVRLGWCIDSLNDDELDMLVSDLQRCFREIRAIPKEVAPNYAITNAIGTACYDHRINAALDYDEDRGGDFIGPFTSEEEFNETLQTPALPDVSHRDGHKIVFTHGDINMRNILMCDGRLSGIVDWENAGWYPEYWDFTKAHYITKIKRRWLGVVDRVFNQDGVFDTEFVTERQLWDYCF